MTPTSIPPSLDLHRIDQGQRERLWKQSAQHFFPGLSVRDMHVNPARGSIRGMPLGPGQLWTILSPPVQVGYRPLSRDDEAAQLLSVMLQIQGATRTSQNGRTCILKTRDICVIDGQLPFELEVEDGFSQLMFLRLPRALALGRHPYLERQTAQPFDPDEAGTQLLRTLLLGLLETGPLLRGDQCTLAITGAVHMLGLPRAAEASRASDLTWRTRSALTYIDSELADPALTANRVAEAQGISRRRLDEILLETLGSSLSAQIWLRRLNQAAEDLRDTRFTSRTVTQIAFGVGFASTAHFTRAFKRRYRCTPRDWREGAKLESVTAQPAKTTLFSGGK